MNGTIDTGKRLGAFKRGGRVLQSFFQEEVFTLALFGAVVAALLDGAAMLNRGTFI